ncbi:MULTISPECIES: translocation/assembly module TamB domain-containing protein [Chitinophagaceae]
MSILVLVLLIVILIQIPSVQNWAKNKAVVYLERKIHTKVSLEKINLRLLDGLQLQQLYIEDQRKDTLLYVNDFKVDISVLQLLRGKAMISNLELNGAVANMYRQKPDTVYNFQYIINAFASGDTAQKPVDTTSSFFVNVQNLTLNSLRLGFHDDVLGMDAKVRIGNLTTSLHNFDTKTLNTDIPSFVLGNSDIAFEQYKPLVALAKTDSTVIVSTGQDTTTISLPIKIGEIALSKINLHYKDAVGNILMDGGVGELHIVPNKIDISKMAFDISKIQLEQTHLLINMGKSASTEINKDTAATAPPSKWRFGIALLNVSQVDLAYNDLTAKPVQTGMDYGHLYFKNVQLAGKDFDLTPTQYKGMVTQGSLSEKGGLKLKKLQTSFAYNDHGASLGRLLLETDKTVLRDSLMVIYPSLDAITKDPGEMFLYAHLSNTSIYMGDILNVAPMLAPYIAGYDKATFKLNTTLKGKVKDLTIPNLELSGLNNTYVKLSGSMRGLPDPNKAYFDLKIDRLQSTLEDIKSLIPKEMHPDSLIHGKGPINLRAAFKGGMSDFSVPYLQLRALRNTAADISARGTGLPNMKKAYFDVNIRSFHTSAADIETLAPLGSIPKDKIRIPDNISASGFFKGGLAAMNTHLNVHTSNGDATIKGMLNKIGNYDFSLGLNDLDVGYIARMDSIMHRLTLQATATGSGLDLNHFDKNKLVSAFNINLDSADFYGYQYKNFNTKGTLNNGILQATTAILDSNIQFNMQTAANILPQYPSIQIHASLDTLNLHKLHFVKDKMVMKGQINADFSNTDPNNLNGNLTLNHFQFQTDSASLQLDSVYFLAKNRDSAFSQMILFADSIVKIDLHGKYKLTEMANAIQNSVMKYYTIPGYQTTQIAPQEWAVNGYIVPKKIFTDYLPQLKGSDSLILRGYLRSKDSSFNFGIRAKNINYAPQRLNAFNLWASTEGDELKFGTGAKEVLSKSFHLFNTGLGATIRRDTITFAIGTTDSASKPWYYLASTLIQGKDSSYTLKVNPEGLMLNYVKWGAPADNELIYDPKKGVFAHNFTLTTAGQSLKLQSVSDTANSPLDIVFDKFKLQTLTNAANQSNIPIEGNLNGTAQLRNLLTHPIFISDIHADSLAYNKQPIGDLALKVSNTEGEDTYTADIALTGNDNDVHLTGNYYNNDQSLDLKLLMNKLNLAIVKPFSTGYLDSVGGYISSNLDIKGRIDTPVINGNLRFNNAYFIPTMTGSKLTLSNENVRLDNQGLHFDNLTIKDPKNNTFHVNGDLLTKNFMDYGFNLKFDAKDFMLIDAPQSDGRFFYGQLAFNTNMTLKGDMASPEVGGSIKVNKQTDFSLVMPSDNPEVQERQGVVVFVTADQRKHFRESRPKLLTDSLTNQSQIKGMDINLNIASDSSAKFALIMDERSGDALRIQGVADLAFGIDKNGKMNLTGNYNLTKGSYVLTLEVIKKTFDIQRGSTITWLGDPLSANANITALYKVKTSPVDLMASQLQGDALTPFKQNSTFTVSLNMKNKLMQPDISFDITLPEESLNQYSNSTALETKLQEVRQDPSEMNKQVFALLLLGRFVGENPLQSAGDATTVGDMALQTASGLLTSQLNKLAGNLVQGVDLNFDLNSGTDYSSGAAQQRTDLTVGVSKRLFNDRIQVNVGSNFALQGSNSNQQATNIAGDVSVDYRLSKDGRYIMRAYRKNQYEGVIEGQVVRTGVGFVFTFDYDQFKDAFRTAKENRAINKAQRKEAREERKKEKAAEKKLEQEQKEIDQNNN